jgi:hypothetical protein
MKSTFSWPPGKCTQNPVGPQINLHDFTESHGVQKQGSPHTHAHAHAHPICSLVKILIIVNGH